MSTEASPPGCRTTHCPASVDACAFPPPLTGLYHAPSGPRPGPPRDRWSVNPQYIDTLSHSHSFLPHRYHLLRRVMMPPTPTIPCQIHLPDFLQQPKVVMSSKIYNTATALLVSNRWLGPCQSEECQYLRFHSLRTIGWDCVDLLTLISMCLFLRLYISHQRDSKK